MNLSRLEKCATGRCSARTEAESTGISFQRELQSRHCKAYKS